MSLQTSLNEIRDLTKDGAGLLNMSRESLETYVEIASSKGELEALRWYRAQRPAGK
ncbi:MAG: hypothetical protein ACKOIB_02915 [Verrucomicrobiota bacterium]